MSDLSSPAILAQPAASSAIEGIWLGSLTANGQSLRVQITVTSESGGQKLCTLDSLDQGAMSLPCANVQYSPPDFSFDVPSVQGHWSGKLSSDGTSLSGTWKQVAALPLTFIKQDKAVEPATRPTVTFAPAIAPVDAADMQAVLDRDFDRRHPLVSISSGISALR